MSDGYNFCICCHFAQPGTAVSSVRSTRTPSSLFFLAVDKLRKRQQKEREKVASRAAQRAYRAKATPSPNTGATMVPGMADRREAAVTMWRMHMIQATAA
eukprot:SAG11_NODE_3_length_39220_cov_67.005828_15_plen_100_part_00